ncbi:MAG: MBL fold metallo-hydrolase [Chloroflexi bacterium]|nr:MAG: MBL fold metallo-hydrolase [Chloroflexota bacterium]
MPMPAVKRIDFGYFVRPAEETGTGKARVEGVLGYVIDHSAGALLFDTGLGEGSAEVDAHYRPVRRPLPEALHDAGIGIGDIRWVANCHLHVDHCGGNPALSGRPIFVQSGELLQARTATDYTLPHLIDFDGADYRQLAGETEILPGVLVIPTPGHTGGHQAIAVRGNDGTVVLAGQARNTAFDYSADQLAWRARQEGRVDDPALSYRPWIERLQSLDPSRIVFAHDYAVWEPARDSLTKP